MTTWPAISELLEVLATPHQAVNGVLSIVDLDVLGDVTVNAIAVPEKDSSFYVAWKNDARNTLSIASPGPLIQNAFDEVLVAGPVELRLKGGLIGYAFDGTEWRRLQFTPGGIPLMGEFGVQWLPRDTNGPCTIVGNFLDRVISVERTGIGEAAITLQPGILTTQSMPLPAFRVTGLGADEIPDMRIGDTGIITPDVVLVKYGKDKKGVGFSEDDLDQDPANSIGLSFIVFP